MGTFPYRWILSSHPREASAVYDAESSAGEILKPERTWTQLAAISTVLPPNVEAGAVRQKEDGRLNLLKSELVRNQVGRGGGSETGGGLPGVVMTTAVAASHADWLYRASGTCPCALRGQRGGTLHPREV